jgi:hypothetical protein
MPKLIYRLAQQPQFLFHPEKQKRRDGHAKTILYYTIEGAGYRFHVVYKKKLLVFASVSGFSAVFRCS